MSPVRRTGSAAPSTVLALGLAHYTNRTQLLLKAHKPSSVSV